MRIRIILILLTMVGCNKLAEDTVTKGKGEYKVDKLFTIDGCTVYRFEDFRTVYFTNCSGKTQYSISCGKGCTEEVGVD